MNDINFHHLSVLLNETINSLNIAPDKIYIDATAGGAGHSSEIAKKLSGGMLLAIDQDPDAVSAAQNKLSGFKCAKVVMGNFRNITTIAHENGIQNADGILMDLGVSSHQLDSPDRGFSYHTDAPLDMRMSRQGLSAKDVVNSYSPADLNRILRDYGEEKFSYRIAQSIVAHRAVTPIETTLELAEIIKSAIPAKFRREGGHPAKQSFQAIRIEVNGELELLKGAIEDSFKLLSVGGRLSIITFHSLEDRLVKQAFAALCVGCTCPKDFPICVCHKTPRGQLVFKKPVIATDEELEINNRSRSAKLRCIEKIKDD